MTLNVDDWDRQWTEFQTINSVAPATEFRRRMVEKLLDIQGSGKVHTVLSVSRFLEGL